MFRLTQWHFSTFKFVSYVLKHTDYAVQIVFHMFGPETTSRKALRLELVYEYCGAKMAYFTL